MEQEEKKQKRLKKILEVAVKGEEAILDSIFEIEDKLEEIEYKSTPEKGDKGDSYELTDEDKKEIASLIEVPIVEKVVEKIIEKTEVIKEQPIINEVTKITNEIVEVAKNDTPDQIIEKINSTEKSIDFKTIKNYPDYSEEIKRLKTAINSTPAVTTSFINGTRAKNINFVGANVSYKDDTAIVTVTPSSIGAVSSVSNSDETLTISPTTGAVIASLNLSKANTWAATQTFTLAPIFSAMTSGSILFAGASGLLSQDNSNFFWDNTNKQLKIGSNSIVNGNSLNPIAIAKTSTSYLATYIQNLSSGTAASTDLIIGNNADDGTVSTGTYLDMGINSSGYTGSGLTNGPGDAYIFNNLEDLILGTGTAGKNVIIGTNIFTGTAASKTRATFTDTGLQMMDGTAANPSISFAGSTTTGLYESSSGVLGVSIAGTSRLTHSATSWDLNSSNGGAVSIGGTSQFMDFSGSVTPSAATSQTLRTSTFVWTPDVNRTAIFGLNNATTVGGSATGLTLTNLMANRAGNAFSGSIGITVTNSAAMEARDVNNQSSGTVVVTNNYGFAVLQNFVMSTTLNAAFVSTMTANSARWNLYMSGTAQNWLAGNLGIGSGLSAPTAKLHIAAGSATANTAPIKLTSGTNLTTAEAGAIEYNNTFHVTNSDATRRHIATAPNTTKVTAGAPYTNDGYVVINIGGTDFKVMTTA